MPHLTRVVCKISRISRYCSQSTKFTFGKSYELIDMDITSHYPIKVLVDDSGRYVSYELYKHCFMSVEESRNIKLDDILN